MAEVTVNGTARTLTGTPVHGTALDFLRGLGLTGAKEGCAEGECGACAILVARPDGPDNTGSAWTALNACLVPAAALDGQEVVTAEGLGDPGDLHPVQRELADRGGSQCGYCTPGFVTAATVLVERLKTAPVARRDLEAAIDKAMGQHICRCTGYVRYFEAVRDLVVATPGLVKG